MAQAWTRTETVQAAQVTGTLTDFPALFSRTHNDFRTIGNGGHVANANGYDLCLYSDAPLSSLLKMETELYVAATGQIIKWGKVASIATSTVVYWGYGDSSITTSQDDPTNVWRAEYKAVYHLGDGSSIGLNDSTTNGFTATKVSTPTAATGEVYGGMGGLSASKYLTADPSATGLQFGSGGQFSLSFWGKLSATGAYQAAIARFIGGNANIRNYNLGMSILNKQSYVQADVPTTGYQIWESTTAYTDTSAFHQIAMTCTLGTGSSLVMYRDGASVAGSWTLGNGNTVPGGGNGTVYWGGNNLASEFWNGAIDEIRIYGGTLSANWIAADYNNQSAPTSFWGLGSESAIANGGGPLMFGGELTRSALLRGGRLAA